MQKQNGVKTESVNLLKQIGGHTPFYPDFVQGD